VSCDGMPPGSARNVRSHASFAPKRRHVHPIVGATDHRAQGDRHNVQQPMLLQVVTARIREPSDVLADARPRQVCHRYSPAPSLGSRPQYRRHRLHLTKGYALPCSRDGPGWREA
jgi:hypothetical protein